MTAARFQFVHPVDVRFRDIDLGGHAHHSQALVYFEEARIAYWREVVGQKRIEELDYILAEVQVRYHARVLYPGRVEVAVRVSRMGRKDLEMEYEVRSASGQRLASGRTIQVMYDYAEGRSKRIPEEIRERIRRFDDPEDRGRRQPVPPQGR